MNLGETVICCGLEGVFLCGSIPVYAVSSIFVTRTGFSVDASRVFPPSVLAIMPLVGCVCCAGVLEPVQDMRWGFLSTLCCPCSGKGGVCPPVAEVETPRLWFDQAPLLLSAFPAPKEKIAEAGEACPVTEGPNAPA